MIKKETGTPQENANAFNTSHEVVIGRSTYLIERHFTGNRDYRQAVFSAVENEAKRTDTEKESA